MPDLPNEDREERFVATGPNQGNTVRGQTGFYTEATSLAFGVNAQGNQCGVYGESIPKDTGRSVPFPPGDGTAPGDPRSTIRTGVCGVGHTYGVVGDGGQRAGIYGQHKGSGAGVIGVGSHDEPGTSGVTGVMGLSLDQRTPTEKTLNPADGNGIGGIGVSDGEQGVGIEGLSVSSPDSEGRVELGNGTGVVGASGTGTGVHGSSVQRHGGVFESLLGAQVNLKPRFETATPPFEGQAGDLLVITTMKEGMPTDGFAELWFCIREDANNEGAIWRKVQFE